ncbi:MAG TPA: site-specific recombinase [Streptosporangiaceae bacterium]|jgi:integrase/recombinase XerD
MTHPGTGVAPVEYAVAVDRYVAEATLGQASRRVYRISLAGWAWPLVGQLPPDGRGRRNARPPIVPLALLDDAGTGDRLAAAVAHRVRQAEPRTVNREVSALRSAIGWWQRRQWISADPTRSLPPIGGIRPSAVRPLTQDQLAALLAAPAPLREQAFWHLLVDSAAAADEALALDADAVDIGARRARSLHGKPIEFSPRTAELLGWLLAGRRSGPVFLTDRRARAGSPAADVYPLSGRGRMSYRRAAEIFTEHTRRLDPDRRGWMLHQLRRRTAQDQRATG